MSKELLERLQRKFYEEEAAKKAAAEEADSGEKIPPWLGEERKPANLPSWVDTKKFFYEENFDPSDRSLDELSFFDENNEKRNSSLLTIFKNISVPEGVIERLKKGDNRAKYEIRNYIRKLISYSLFPSKFFEDVKFFVREGEKYDPSKIHLYKSTYDLSVNIFDDGQIALLNDDFQPVVLSVLFEYLPEEYFK
jgi:hypothetical protein